MGFYGDDIVDKVREATDIVELISGYLPLKRKGRNYWARCPFHQEKTPSFSVSPDKQIFYCFGCHKGGNALTFVMEYEKIPFADALELLAARVRIALPEQARPAASRETEALYFAHEVAMKFFSEQLRESRSVLQYLKQRALKDDTIEEFQLGYAHASWNALIRHAAPKSLDEQTLQKAGLVLRSEQGRYYDRFRDRLIFPIFNIARKPIAFGARTLKQDDEPKYINSPETPLYQKSHVLYGLSHTRGEIRKKEEAVVVEGYFDFLSLHQVGVRNIAATSGTAFTFEQAQLLARSAPSVILMFDSDSAGRQAALRSVEHLFEAGLDVRIANLPAGEDPDSLARKQGSDAVLQCLKEAQSYVQFSLTMLPDRYDNLSISVKEKAINHLTSLAGKIDNPIKRELFLQEIARWYRIDLTLIKRNVRVATHKAVAPPQSPQEHTRLEEDLIALLLQYPYLIDSGVDRISPNDFENTTLGDLFSLIALLREEELDVSPSQLIDKVREPARKQLIAALAARELGTSAPDALLGDLVLAFEKRHRAKRLAELRRLLEAAELENDQAKVDFYLREINSLRMQP